MTPEEALVERVAEAMHAVEYGKFSETARYAHNQWTWPCVTEAERGTWRLYAQAAIQAIPEGTTT